MTGPAPQDRSSYLDHLPAVFSDDPFAGRFLLAFEAVFSGRDGVVGLEEIIGRVVDHLDPLAAPADFLPWLAGWVALSLRADWDVEVQRGFLAEIVSLYRLRGTKAGLKRMLEIYLWPVRGVQRNDVEIEDFAGSDDTDRPVHYFQVRLTLSDTDPMRLRTTQETARAIIDQEKPAHTFYALKVVIPTMRLVSEQFKADHDGIPELLILGDGATSRLGTRPPPEPPPTGPTTEP